MSQELIKEVQSQIVLVANDTINLVEDLSQLIKLYRKLRDQLIPPFKPTTYIVDIDWVAKRLEKLPNWKWSRWMPLDAKYHAVMLQDWEKIIAWDRTNLHKYFADFFDCDKYAMYFKSNVAWFFGVNTVAVVLDYDAGHAYNIIMPFDREEPLIYEPQTDQIIPIDKRNTEFYKLAQNYFVIM